MTRDAKPFDDSKLRGMKLIEVFPGSQFYIGILTADGSPNGLLTIVSTMSDEACTLFGLPEHLVRSGFSEWDKL